MSETTSNVECPIEPYMRVLYPRYSESQLLRRGGKSMMLAQVVGSIGFAWVIEDLEDGRQWLVDEDELQPVSDAPMLSQPSGLTGDEPMLSRKA